MRVRLQRLYPGAKLLSGGEAMVVPLPTAGGEPLGDAALLAWVSQLLDALWPLPPKSAPAAPEA